MKKTITVNYETWKKLMFLKIKSNSESLDKVINSLLKVGMKNEKKMG